MLESILSFIAGLGIFLFAVKILGGALEKISSVKIKRGLNKLSKNCFAGTLFGTFMAFITQSSLASVVMTMSFADSYMLSFFSAIAIIFGCNIGTSLSTVLISFNSLKITSFLAILVLVGALMATFSKNKKVKDVGTVIASFGMFFVGLQLLSDACSVLKTNTAFLNFFSSLNSPALYFLIGIIVTLITQSSTVTIALLISIVGTTTSFEVISLLNCAFAIYGSNIGTALTSFFMSFSGGIESKRVAFSHVVFNVLGTIFFLIFTALGFLNIFELITINSSFVIVLINVIFNVVTAIILYPFMKLLFKFCNLVINEKIKKENEIYYLKNVNLSSANIHLNQLNLCVIDLINKIEKVSKEVRAYCEDYSVTHSIEIAKKLDKLLSLNDKVKNNIIRIQGDIQGEEERLYFLQVTNKNIEWIIRNNLRIINYIKQFKDNKIYFTQKQIATFKEMYESLKIITDNVKLIVELINKDGDKKEYLKPNFEIFEASENLSNIVSKVKREMISTNIYSEKKLDRYDMFINVVNTLDNTASIFIDIGLTVTNYLTENKEA